MTTDHHTFFVMVYGFSFGLLGLSLVVMMLDAWLDRIIRRSKERDRREGLSKVRP